MTATTTDDSDNDDDSEREASRGDVPDRERLLDEAEPAGGARRSHQPERPLNEMSE